MKKPGNRERILVASVELFNASGIVAITTNHVASHLGISPGNLYFHFRNKEEIVSELFDQMCEEIYSVWMPNKRVGIYSSPLDLIERTYVVFWNYRFFHREMYHLRRKDPVLAKKWRTHLKKSVRLLNAMYSQWIKAGVMKKIDDAKEMQMISDVVLITSSSFLQFFESPDKPASRRTINDGVNHVLRFLLPYHSDGAQSLVRQRLA
jgi:AcrR family transcriptional regulator